MTLTRAVSMFVLVAALSGCAMKGDERSPSPITTSVPGVSVLVRVSEQKLYLIENGKVVLQYPVSTSKFGIGNQAGSFRTPLGRHRVAEKIGAGAPLYTVFKERVNTRRLAAVERTLKGAPYDDVTTRILWLEGLEPGVNRGPGIDSKERFIYIHGTPSEGLIGRPASNGCVRMYNEDVIDLFDRVRQGTPVMIQA
jgi:lipoprotein-anchoring transpeptidase ErfK/SrfK